MISIRADSASSELTEVVDYHSGDAVVRQDSVNQQETILRASARSAERPTRNRRGLDQDRKELLVMTQ